MQLQKRYQKWIQLKQQRQRWHWYVKFCFVFNNIEKELGPNKCLLFSACEWVVTRELPENVRKVKTIDPREYPLILNSPATLQHLTCKGITMSILFRFKYFFIIVMHTWLFVSNIPCYPFHDVTLFMMLPCYHVPLNCYHVIMLSFRCYPFIVSMCQCCLVTMLPCYPLIVTMLS